MRKHKIKSTPNVKLSDSIDPDDWELAKENSRGTDSVQIGSDTSSMTVFGWSIARTLIGKNLNGNVHLLNRHQQKFLEQFNNAGSDEYESLIEHYYNEKNLSKGDKTNQEISVTQTNVDIDPIGTATIREAMKTVDGVKYLWRPFVPYGILRGSFKTS